MRIITIITLFSMMLTSCEELDLKGFVAHSSLGVNARFQESINYNKKVEYPSRLYFKDGPIHRFELESNEYALYYGTDIHVSDSTDNVEALISLTNSDSLAIATLLGGDMIQRQVGWEGIERCITSCKNEYGTYTCKPILATVGNHDLFYGQWAKYCQLFHTSTWYVEIDRKKGNITECDVLISLDSGDGVLGEHQKEWLVNLLTAIRNAPSDIAVYKNIFVMTHTNLFNTCDVSNFPLTETYSLCRLLSRNRVNTVLMGHDHHRSINTFGGVNYIMVEALKQENHGSIEPGICRIFVKENYVMTDFCTAEKAKEMTIDYKLK